MQSEAQKGGDGRKALKMFGEAAKAASAIGDPTLEARAHARSAVRAAVAIGSSIGAPRLASRQLRRDCDCPRGRSLSTHGLRRSAVLLLDAGQGDAALSMCVLAPMPLRRLRSPREAASEAETLGTAAGFGRRWR